MNLYKMLNLLIFFDYYYFKDTLVTWYRSCYKTDFPRVRKIVKTNLNDPGCKPKNPTEIVQKILYEIFVKDMEIFSPEFRHINELCDSKSQTDALEKLEILTKFRHNLCGHVYRNSIKLMFLQAYVLKQNYSNASEKNNSNTTIKLDLQSQNASKTAEKKSESDKADKK